MMTFVWRRYLGYAPASSNARGQRIKCASGCYLREALASAKILRKLATNLKEINLW
jgi:hypothetical protein